MLLSLTIANVKMIYRNRQALFWALAFPLIFVTAFGVFKLDAPPNTTILVVDRAKDEVSRGLLTGLAAVEHFTLEDREDEAQARKELEDGDASYVMIIPQGLAANLAQNQGQKPIGITLLYDRGNTGAAIILGVVQRFIEEANRQLTQAPTLLALEPQGIQARQLTYFDFLLPGFVAMGVMIYSIIGIAAALALYREQKILKRILATPVKVRAFFAAQVLAHLLLSLIQAAVILAAGVFIFHGHIYGNLLWVFAIVILSNIIFLNIGFIVGAVSKNVRAADGLANAIAMPMMFFSGVFFPPESMPVVLANVVKYLPLTPMLQAMRGVALEAKGPWDYPVELAILGAWIVGSSLLAVKLFRFN